MGASISLTGSLTALAVFMTINSITPGPNNLMLLHGSIKRGFWHCRWHILGISAGVLVMLALSYWGMAALIVRMPALMLVVKVLGTLYLLWLTYQMAKSDFVAIVSTALAQERQGHTPVQKGFGELPLNLWQAAAFQWLNPKAWTMTMVAPSIAMVQVNQADGFPLATVLLLLLCALINIACISCWAAGGHWLRRLIHFPRLIQGIHALIVLMTLYCALALWL